MGEVKAGLLDYSELAFKDWVSREKGRKEGRKEFGLICSFERSNAAFWKSYGVIFVV